MLTARRTAMPLAPFLHFQGDCAEALSFYAGVFDDPAPTIMRYSEAPEGDAGAGGDRVMYGAVDTGEGQLMASDYPPDQPGDAQAAVSVSISYADAVRARTVFDRLSEGGAVIMPWGRTFFAKGFGMVKDRFGTHWMVSIDAAQD
jgi:PhnB protein